MEGGTQRLAGWLAVGGEQGGVEVQGRICRRKVIPKVGFKSSPCRGGRCSGGLREECKGRGVVPESDTEAEGLGPAGDGGDEEEGGQEGGGGRHYWTGDEITLRAIESCYRSKCQGV